MKIGKLFEKPNEKPTRMKDKKASMLIEKTIDFNLTKELESNLFHNGRQLMEVLARLVLELKDKLQKYDTIISDDASGRIPSLLLRKIVNKEREKSGREKIPIYFLAGGQTHGDEIKMKQIDKFLKNRKNSLGKVLLITEYISTGRSIHSLSRILENNKIDFDIATVSLDPDYEIKINSISKILNKLIYGEISPKGLDIYRAKAATGVKKHGILGQPHPRKKTSEEYDESQVRKARKDIDKLAEELSKLL